MNRAARVAVIATSVAIFCYAGIGHVLGRTPDDRAYKSLTVYGEVLQKIQQDYVDEPNIRVVTAGSLHGLLESLDSESSYLTPPEYDEYKKKLQSPGTGETGLTLSKRFGYVIVISVLPDSPGTKAGIRSGDIFESISGFTTREMGVGQAENLLSGPAGSGVKVSVIRRGKTTPEDIELVREKLAPARIISEKVNNDTLVEADKQGIHKVILDLRECGRGPATEGVAAARLFVSGGTLATLRGQTVATQIFSAEPNKVVWKGPLSVLTDATTSGASEVLASAILATHRGDVVGERTFGLASEQKTITMDNGAAMVLTVANFYNSSGKSILEEGVTPSEVVHAVAEDAADGSEDGDVTPDDHSGPEIGPKPLSTDDVIFHKALDLLNTATAKKAA